MHDERPSHWENFPYYITTYYLTLPIDQHRAISQTHPHAYPHSRDLPGSVSCWFDKSSWGLWIWRYRPRLQPWPGPANSPRQGRSLSDLHRRWNYVTSWWRHQMETFSALLTICAGNSPVTGEFPAQRPETRSFDVFFDLHLNKRLSKQSSGWWFETPPCP